MNKKYESDNECLIDKPYTTTISNRVFFFIIALIIFTSLINNLEEKNILQPTKTTIRLACYTQDIK